MFWGNGNKTDFVEQNVFLTLTHWSLGNLSEVFDKQFSSKFKWFMAEVSFCEFTVRWISIDLTDDKSTLVQVMAWYHQTSSHYLNQCWPSFVTPYGITRPQWVKSCHDEFMFYLCYRANMQLMSWQPKKTGHQLVSYWFSLHRIFWIQQWKC